ncbi:hypothetical protein [Planomonospora sp. ID82291]|uniref:hypothetical protein n=1 Tax=Planomonospora sp. ID82291 TaxID=2738136 RepID=UPI0018C36CD5|nr:hypothetical protein [Planomonospora sp. ID82291]MBG0818258.1 hypothetical protein [Planomonospora sp. ID82291]
MSGSEIGNVVLSAVRLAVVISPVMLAVGALAFLVGAKVGRAHSAREVARLKARLGTFARVLAPLPQALRAGRGGAFIARQDLAVLALLVEHEGPDGEQLVALEEVFRNSPASPTNGHVD